MYLLAVIGIEVNDDTVNARTHDLFRYIDKLYSKWLDVNIQQLILDVKKVPAFYISQNVGQLEIHFNPNADKQESKLHYKSRKRICELFLQKENGDMLYEPNLHTLPSEVAEIKHFYDLELDLLNLYADLKEAHRNRQISDNVPADLQHPLLKPVLRQYQIEAIRWMIHRELTSDFLPTEFVTVKTISDYNRNSDCKIFYYNKRTLELFDYKPTANKIPSGGILADEMGLGKTVEILGLILWNKKKKRKFGELFDEEISSIPKRDCDSVQTVVCICNNSIKKKVKYLICCTKCFKYQHRKCVLKYTETANRMEDNYICPSCWRNHVLIETGATIIVSPVAIKLQWQAEINKHIQDANFRIFIYNGITETGWINPIDMAKYDVILTDYNVLKSEIYFANSINRNGLRYEKKFLTPVSPLPLINWWRVCLDESQLVETPTNLCSKMVKALPTTHRWAVTGTPVEKKIDNLHGLLYFLDCYPYTDFEKWSELSRQFQNGNNKPLIDVLSKIMWRTCKNDVLDQINIPPQITILEYVTLSDVESFFYKSQHENYWKIFQGKAMKIKIDLSVSKMDPHTLKLLMEPLRKIRQDCTIPSIFQKHSSNPTATKKFLKPNELLSVLLVNNENDCKSELRSIISSLNGLAGIHIIRKEFESAAKLYNSVIRRAMERDGSNVTVDTLQQIHAIYNLIEISNHLESENLSELHDKLSKLERKYIDACYTLVQQCENQLEATKISVDEVLRNVDKNWKKGNWITDLLNEIDEEHEGFVINRIRFELGSHTVTNDISSFYGIQYVVLVWWEELLKYRDELMTQFINLNYFIKNLNDANMSEKDKAKIELLIKSAFECHLKIAAPAQRIEPKPKLKRCEICKLKAKLVKYECFVFDKHSTENSDENMGTWNPTYQEKVVRIILNFLQSKNSHAFKIYENYMNIIDLFKKEFKEYSKLWVEVNYTASAFDELNMCKSILHAMDPTEMSKEDAASKNIISIYDIEDVFIEFQDQLNQAELNFVKYLGRIKYLKHLEDKKEPDVCPICTKKPENKYMALQCGHIMCEICLTQMKIYQKSFLICCICRNKQRYNEVFSITCKVETNNSEDPYKGDYSTKVETIVRKILQLLADDSAVKIIIFSHWMANLKVISEALDENKIKYRLKSNKIQKCLNDFKNATNMVTCLLLPLEYGSKGLNLIEATHIFLVEPILNPGEELQAVGRIHRIGQTQNTFVHKFVVRSTIEETIYNTITNDETGKWRKKCITIENLQNLFKLE